MNSARKQLGAGAIAILLICAPPVAAQDPIVDGYGGAGGVAPQVVSGTAGSGAPEAFGTNGADRSGVAPGAERASADTQGLADQGGNELPFTGFDVALIIAGGLLLLSIGLGARWLSRSQPTVP